MLVPDPNSLDYKLTLYTLERRSVELLKKKPAASIEELIQYLKDRKEKPRRK